jgi:hypothetical protein
MRRATLPNPRPLDSSKKLLATGVAMRKTLCVLINRIHHRIRAICTIAKVRKILKLIALVVDS